MILSCIGVTNMEDLTPTTLIIKPRTATAIPFIYCFSGNCAASVPISTFMCLWTIYIFPGSVYKKDSTYFLQQKRETHRGNIYVIRSQTYECGNWDWDPDIPFLEIFVSKKFSAFCLCSAWHLQYCTNNRFRLRTYWVPTVLLYSPSLYSSLVHILWTLLMLSPTALLNSDLWNKLTKKIIICN